MRKILLAIGVLLALAVAVAIYFIVNVDSVVHSRIERTGSRIAGVPVTVGSVDISLARGTATIGDLAIANPPGFSDQPAIRFGEIGAAVKVVSGVITRIHAARPSIRVEGRADRTNLDVLRGNTGAPPAPDATAGGPIGGGGKRKDKDAAGKDRDDKADTGRDDEPSDTYVIERIEISGASAVIDLEGMDGPEQLELEELVLTNLSGTRSQITRQIISQLIDDIMAAVERRVLASAEDAAREAIEKRADELKEKARAKLEEYLQGN